MVGVGRATLIEELSAEQQISEQTHRQAEIASSFPGVIYRFRLTPDGKFFMDHMSEGGPAIFERSMEELTQQQLIFDDVPS